MCSASASWTVLVSMHTLSSHPVLLPCAAARPKADRSAAAKKAAETKKRKAAEAGKSDAKKAK